MTINSALKLIDQMGPKAGLDAYSDEAGHRFRFEAGQSFRFHSGRRSDLKAASFGLILGRVDPAVLEERRRHNGMPSCRSCD
ncbi:MULTISPECIES: hypothetical protein [Mesorhizobium]|uniref:Uncharacterized protein n=4 Tax=Mesorhizobium TaxID=68287 RepID=A0ABU4YT62_9HYPH|nr:MULTISPECIES: hypothetical protein [Mesorhizobium]MDX8528872.1 hypothetical protein [Mesorhizobium sp. MSK_1335]MDX8437918.1 hypothetical protein [Mesorhizobium abyssinicae]MDX8443805.1 hypothetical protein [Mesorhizobium sp. VK3E]MDX8463525.1 hypothetical protein [Mesorhizobium sp. VK2D]MDX8483299.1 hypothetical protein [Mesorhizobium sp. VK24D]